MTAGPIAFAARDVTYRIGSVTILQDVTLDIAYGRLLALVGPNGAGKSTLLGVLTGDLTPTGGRATLDGTPVGQWEPRTLARTRAVLLQSNQVAFSFTARQVVEMGRSPWIGTEQSARDEAIVAGALAGTDTTALAGRGFPSLSGGERARVSLARVLAQDTRVVLLDEPTAALDLRHQEDVLTIARRLAHEGRAVVVVLHDLSLAAAYADEIAIIHRTRLAAHGVPDEVITAERIEAVYGTPVRVIRDPDTNRPLVIPKRYE